MKSIIIIPARYDSRRFPGKPLAVLGGRPVVEWVYEKALSVTPDVYVATDDSRILNAVESFGGKAVMTRKDHSSGTDRVKEAADIIRESGKTDFELVVNIQGDEPCITREQIETVCRQFDNPQTEIATLGKTFRTMEEAEDANSPKVVRDINGFALYFSRSVIPFVCAEERGSWISRYPFMKHIGIYAYRPEVLDRITALPQSPLERAEMLEQLRWLENGYRIRVGVTDTDTIGIDTPEDIRKAELLLGRK